MSREIKFRFYYTEWDKYEYSSDYDYVSDFWICYENAIDKKTIELFTGIKDRNGKEIYEGDKIRITCGTSIPNEYVADMFELRQTITDFGGVVEIIGNIYEDIK